ncbi:MAG: radical SAM protein, partial [Acidobacteria bacterium]|nr:radical SAM protein [Acidobacteriota bacterium]
MSKEPCFPVATLRVSVTDRCNLRCAYCMPAQGVRLVGRDSMLSLEELADAVSWIHERKPLRKIKITGGEPLVRRGLSSFVAILAALEGRPEISMTSNGT